MTVTLVNQYALVGAGLFVIGAMGFLTRRNLIVMFLCAEMMLQAVGLNLVAYGKLHGDFGGQMFTIFILAVAASEAAIALALVISLWRCRHSLDATLWQELREEGVAGETVADEAEITGE